MKTKTLYFCTECGNETARWQGQCPACGAWNSLAEGLAEKKKAPRGAGGAVAAKQTPLRLAEIGAGEEQRFSTGVSELDRVLGGGAVRGSLVLVGGAPGIGKSTILLQLCGKLQGGKVLYVTGEESLRQLKLRAERLGVDSEKLYVLAETELESVVEQAETLNPEMLIIDSIQTLYSTELDSTPGSIGQVKACTTRLLRIAKDFGVTTFLVSHVNKEGAIAGPKVLEHMVDCVLYFEGERSQSYRILRTVKNRFGSTNEIGVFEMRDTGLECVPNPSEMLLSGRPVNEPGTCVTCVMEGTRPLLAEIQALVTPSGYNSGRRNANGIEYNRAMLLMAVLEKRGGMNLAGCDSYINVTGGMELEEPAADLATVLALASSFRDVPIGENLVAIGEVGLTGEIRSVGQLDQRLAEVRRMGFTECIIPAGMRHRVQCPEGLKLLPAKDVRHAIAFALG
ncbi:MAG: DNA repair protein RadA [Oscillospiraceae bacterium]|nr:DNA repair protein RadA [Oscillospiraceae bacterium]